MVHFERTNKKMKTEVPMQYGWTGKRLIVNLSSGETGIESISEKMQHRFIGGRGLNSATLLKEIPSNCDPFGPDVILSCDVAVNSRTVLSAYPKTFSPRPACGESSWG